MSARLHVLLGEGGVGKTTLAAGYAIALAAQGGHVALLSIDPARRLQTALGFTIDEKEVKVPVPGELHAALLSPAATLRRWATEGLVDDATRARLLQNRLFDVLADRLAATTDVIAAVRIAEWLENDPDITDFVVDTAPGRNGLEFLKRPRALVAFSQGRLVRWLGHLAAPGGGHGLAGLAGIRILRALAPIGGKRLLDELAELLASVQGPFARVLERLQDAQARIDDPTTEILLVTTVREDAATRASEIRDALREVNLKPGVVVVNRVLPSELGGELAALDGAVPLQVAGLLRYARSYCDIERRVIDAVRPLATRVVTVHVRTTMETDRQGTLAALGQELLPLRPA